MFKRILVPLDGSSRAERAIPIAARIARAVDGRVLLLEVVSPPSHFMESVAEIAEPALLDANPQAEDYLAGLTKLECLAGVHTKTEVIWGQAAERIIAAATTNKTDLIVMCSHGYTGMMRWFIGSVAEKVARHAPVPVLILRERGSLPGEMTGPARIVVPLDGSERAEIALRPAAQLASALSAPARGKLHLTYVVVLSRTEPMRFDDKEKIMAEAKVYLSNIVEHLPQHLHMDSGKLPDLSVTWSVTTEDDIATGIIHTAENGEQVDEVTTDINCPVIAMATHGRGGLDLWPMGSITERVLLATRLPLMIVRK